MSEELRTCPFCGGEAEARGGSSTMPYIRCKSCGCRTGSSYDMDKLKESWNRRAERTYHPERISTVYHSAIVCSECKHRLDEVTIYCPYCGARLEGVGR